MILGGLIASRGDIRTGESTSVVMLGCRTGDIKASPEILDAVLKAHERIMTASYHNVSEDTVDLIKEMKNELEEQLKVKEKLYNAARVANLVFTTKTPGGAAENEKSSLTERAKFQEKLETMVTRNAEINAHLEAMGVAKENKRSKAALVAMAERFVGTSLQPNADAPSERLIELISKERELAATFGDDYQPLLRLRAQIAFMKSILPANRQPPEAGDKEDPIDRHVRQLNEERETNQTLITAYDKLIKAGQERMKDALTKELETEKLKGDYQRTKELWDLSAKRLQEINLVKNMVGISTLVLAQPSEGRKVAPILTSSLSLSGFLGVLIGLGLVYLAEMTDRSFKGPDDVVSRLGAPVIAHMPAIDYKKLVSASDLEPGTSLSPVLCVHYRPKSRDAEAVRGIRTAIFFGNQSNTTRLIQFTSAQAGDGKSTLACNVAISIAQTGKRVILVEADLRRPSFCNVFGKNPEVGFAQVLEGSDRWQDNLLTFPEIPNLAVLPCGQRPQHPAELLTGPLLAETLDQMKEAYDYIIIDTPPLLPVTDPCSVAARADGVILVVQMGRNTRPNAERACSLLETLGVRLLGIVMNRMTKDGGYGYGYGSYGYNYGGSYKYGGYAYRSNGYYSRGESYYEEDHRNGVEGKSPT
jgi:capsular exopolysaccharide synthesis family protein